MPVPQQLVDAGVSAREAEVLKAVGQHLTNAEIGARLYISVRTVESHVSSLLRKLGLENRRALAELASELPNTGSASRGAADAPAAEPVNPAVLPPVPLTSFVGRAEERAALADAVREHRLVTAVGPGGVGKTRLAVAVASDQAHHYPAGVWYTDLVPVTDPAMIAPAVAGVLGLGAPVGLSELDAVIQAVAQREGLLILDNCEHLVDGIAVFVEKLLASGDRMHVLATSRTRLLVPFEHVYQVPGLSLSEEAGDAVALFQARAAAVGSPITDQEDLRRAAAVCRALDGLALAIELAAVRLPTLGIGGLEAGLGDRLRLLAGGSRVDDRHSSLRTTLDWSYELADLADRAVLRRVAVFAAPFTVDAAAAVAGLAPLPVGETFDAVAEALGRLADQSLVVVRPGIDGLRYGLLETVRQYGDSRLEDAGEASEVRERHLQWSWGVVAELDPAATAEPGARWRETFDAVADDLRAAFGWLAAQEDRRSEAYDLAMALGAITFHRGLAEEAQRRFEQAAALTDGAAAAIALHDAAGAAAERDAGNEALRLHQEAADAATQAGEKPQAARDLALAATLLNRAPGLMQSAPTVDAADLIAKAEALACGDPTADLAILIAKAFARWEIAPGDDSMARQAAGQGRELGDPLLESAALDQLTVVQLATGQLQEAAASAQRRIELLTSVAPRAATNFELHDAHSMAVETYIGVGDLPAARQLAEPLLRHPESYDTPAGWYVRGNGQLGALRLVVADALAGYWDVVLEAASRFRQDWERQGRPRIPVHAKGAAAVAMVHGLRGDSEAHEDWSEIYRTLRYTKPRNRDVWASVAEAVDLLHHSEPTKVARRMAADPTEQQPWYNGLWRQWYAALQAEAAVLAGHPQVGLRLERASRVVAGNPIATALVTRTDAWVRNDRDRLLAAAEDLDAAGCPYQVARTLVLAGGNEAAEGARLMADLGAAPMAAPVAHPDRFW